MRAFVTGGNGFLGRHLISCLAETYPEMEMIALVRDLKKSAWMTDLPRTKSNITRVTGDLLQPESYAEYAQSSNLVFHLAGLVGLRDGQAFYRQNVEATQCLLDVLKRSDKLQRLVFTSTISAVDRPMAEPAIGPMTENSVPCPNTDYGKSKRQAELAIEQSGVPYTILRPSYIYGPYPRKGSSMDRLVWDMRQEKSYTRIPFPGRASAIYAPDLAQALAHAAESFQTLNKTYFAANREPYRVAEVYRILAETMGIKNHTLRALSQGLRARFQRVAYQRFPAQPLVRVMFEDSFYCRSERLWEDLAWEPPTDLETGIRETLLWYQCYDWMLG